MSAYTKLLYHIVFSTKQREPTLVDQGRKRFFGFVRELCRNRRSHLRRVNCEDDHVHLLVDIHTTIAVADFVRDIKRVSSRWIGNERIFPEFSSWQEGYGAFTVSPYEKDTVIEYIENQRAHHRSRSYLDEYKHLLINADLEVDERYFP